MGNGNSNIENTNQSEDQITFGAARSQIINFTTGEVRCGNENYSVPASSFPTIVGQVSYGGWSAIRIQPIDGYPEFTTLKNLVDNFRNNIKNFKIEIKYTGFKSDWDCYRRYAINRLYFPDRTFKEGVGTWSSNERDTAVDVTSNGWVEMYEGNAVGNPLTKGDSWAMTTVCTPCACERPENPSGDFTNMNFFMRVTGTIDVGNFCLTNLTNTTVCNRYCLSPYNENCLDSVLINCFKNQTAPDGSASKTIILNETCKNWIKENVSRGGSTQIDQKMVQTCKDLSIDPTNYTQSIDIQNTCSCYFDPSIYDNYYKSLITIIPEIQFAGLGSNKCLFPGCPISPFKPVDILGDNKCPSVQCIQGVSLNNNGQIAGNVNISLDAQCSQFSLGKSCNQDIDCAAELICDSNVCRKRCTTNSNCPANYICNTTTTFCEKSNVTPPPPSPSPSSQNDNTIWFIIGGIVFLLLVIGLVLFFLLKRRKVSSEDFSEYLPSYENF
jgi:hypothetical protein